MNEASALAVNCHTSLCILSHPKRKGKEGKDTDDIIKVIFKGQGRRYFPKMHFTAIRNIDTFIVFPIVFCVMFLFCLTGNNYSCTCLQLMYHQPIDDFQQQEGSVLMEITE